MLDTIRLGGGKGRMTRLHGLTSDMLLAVELVTPSGERVTANASHHADLFWLARGAAAASSQAWRPRSTFGWSIGRRS